MMVMLCGGPTLPRGVMGNNAAGILETALRVAFAQRQIQIEGNIKHDRYYKIFGLDMNRNTIDRMTAFIPSHCDDPEMTRNIRTLSPKMYCFGKHKEGNIGAAFNWRNAKTGKFGNQPAYTNY